MNVLCLAIDRLHAGYVGALGNTWIATPQLDRLAAESLVFDRAMTDSTDVREVFTSLLCARHAAESGRRAAPSLPSLLAESGYRTWLVTDDEAISQHALAGDFSETISLDRRACEVPCASEEETHLAELFATSAEQLAMLDEPFLYWLQTAALDGPWDAPLRFRQRYLDEEEDESTALQLTAPPHMVLDEDFDPDERMAVAHAYAAQVSLLDLCLGVFLDTFRASSFAERTLLVLLAPRGMPLGEHRLVGAHGGCLHAEQVHVPWLIRFPSGLARLARTQALAQPADLAPTIFDWLGRPLAGGDSFGQSLLPLARGELESHRERACTVSGAGLRRLTTRAWSLVEAVDLCNTSDGNDLPAPVASRLYANPDDRWEANDVANRCQAEADGLSTDLASTLAALAAGRGGNLAPLDANLM